jgi:hypothetical protein
MRPQERLHWQPSRVCAAKSEKVFSNSLSSPLLRAEAKSGMLSLLARTGSGARTFNVPCGSGSAQCAAAGTLWLMPRSAKNARIPCACAFVALPGAGEMQNDGSAERNDFPALRKDCSGRSKVREQGKDG